MQECFEYKIVDMLISWLIIRLISINVGVDCYKD